ncbi:MAG: hypothetical protein EA365_00375 [Gloeocapsa sp. DLM2.Bin57]|nr:MAG: hypothetical protein EA365_00375 [Gloeocapsa sp. DLM2.Bin57]
MKLLTSRIMLTTLTLIALGGLSSIIQIPDAQAVVGRPATPGSVAGVSRRTSRRVIRRSTIYVASLPGGCGTVVIEGMQLYQCGSTYYQPYNDQYVVVYVD